MFGQDIVVVGSEGTLQGSVVQGMPAVAVVRLQ